MRRNIRKHGREGEIPRENPVIPGKDNTIHFSESFAKIDCILDAKEVEEAVEMSPFRLWCLLMKVSKPMKDIHGTSNIDADLHLLSKCRKASSIWSNGDISVTSIAHGSGKTTAPMSKDCRVLPPQTPAPMSKDCRVLPPQTPADRKCCESSNVPSHTTRSDDMCQLEGLF
ncbi:hypothetical protein ABG067_002921 [Albugo candida]